MIWSSMNVHYTRSIHIKPNHNKFSLKENYTQQFLIYWNCIDCWECVWPKIITESFWIKMFLFIFHIVTLARPSLCSIQCIDRSRAISAHHISTAAHLYSVYRVYSVQWAYVQSEWVRTRSASVFSALPDLLLT